MIQMLVDVVSPAVIWSVVVEMKNSLDAGLEMLVNVFLVGLFHQE